MLSCVSFWYFFNESLTQHDLIATLYSLPGSILTTLPQTNANNISLKPTISTAQAANTSRNVPPESVCIPKSKDYTTEPHVSQHALASIVAFIGVLGASSVFVALWRIGKRAHSLVSASYLSLMSVLISRGCTHWMDRVRLAGKSSRMALFHHGWNLRISGTALHHRMTAA